MSVSTTSAPRPRVLDFLAGAVFGVVVGVAATLLLARNTGRTASVDAAAPPVAPAPTTPPDPVPVPPPAVTGSMGFSADDASSEEKRRRARMGLLAKVEAGKASIAEIRMLKALCQSDGDKACVTRANAELAKGTKGESTY